MNSLDLFPIAPSEPDAVGRGQENVRRSAAMQVKSYTTPCSTPWCGPPQERCHVGGGDAPWGFMGRAFCTAHAPSTFFDFRTAA